MSKKRLMAVAALLTLATSVAACSSGGSASSGSTPASTKVTLSYALWDALQVPAMKKIITAFEKQYPNITVNTQVTPYTDYWTKLQTAASGGAAPDVFWMNGPNFQLYASNGQLMSLTGLPGVSWSNYPATLDDTYTYQGVHYGVPKDFDTIALWYNKSIFNAAHVAYPNANWTWADFDAAAAKLTNSAKGIYGVGPALDGQEDFYDTIAQAGGYVISANEKTSGYDTPGSVAGLQFWANLIAKHESPTLAQLTDTAALNMFESGKLAMYWGGSWDAEALAALPALKNDVNVTVLPEGVKRATIINGLGNVIYAKTAHPQQAKEFVEFLGSKQAAQIQADTGTVLPAFNGTQQAWVNAYPQYDAQAFLTELPYAVAYPVSKDTAAWNTLETSLLPKAWNLSKPVSVVAAQLASQMDQALAKESS